MLPSQVKCPKLNFDFIIIILLSDHYLLIYYCCMKCDGWSHNWDYHACGDLTVLSRSDFVMKCGACTD